MFHLHKVILKVNVVQTIGGNGKQVILKYRSPTCFKGTAQVILHLVAELLYCFSSPHSKPPGYSQLSYIFDRVHIESIS